MKSELRPRDHCVAWEKLMDGGLEVYEAPDDHSGIIQESYAGLWGEQLRTSLNTAQEGMYGKQK